VVTDATWDCLTTSTPPIAKRDAFVDGTPGVDIYPELKPAAGEHVIKKHRYSGFFGTDLDIILREWGVDTVIISGTTTENCCHATARDAMFRNYRVVFLSDATATYDYPDRGFGAMQAADVHHATLVILAASTAHVMPVKDIHEDATDEPGCHLRGSPRAVSHWEMTRNSLDREFAGVRYTDLSASPAISAIAVNPCPCAILSPRLAFRD